MGSATISGNTDEIISEAYVYGWNDDIVNDDCWLHAGNGIVFEVTNGEAYDCRLTAWDNATHSTTANLLLAGNHYRVIACAYRAGGRQGGQAEADEKQYPSSEDLLVNRI